MAGQAMSFAHPELLWLLVMSVPLFLWTTRGRWHVASAGSHWPSGPTGARWHAGDRGSRRLLDRRPGSTPLGESPCGGTTSERAY